MSDTSGRINYGTIKKDVRRVLVEVRKHQPGVPVGKKPTTSEKAQAAAFKLALPRELVWSRLHSTGLLDRAFVDSELVAYLKRLAEFIETAATFGLDGVMKEFEVKGDTPFSTLQRNIREKVVIRTSTEFNGAAKRAFQVGSTNWASKLTKQTDPTKLRVNDLVGAVRRNVDYALILSPTLILQDYGQRLIESLLPGGETNRREVEDTLQAYRQQFAAFMRDHNDAALWSSANIALTLRKYAALLLK